MQFAPLHAAKSEQCRSDERLGRNDAPEPDWIRRALHGTSAIVVHEGVTRNDKTQRQGSQQRGKAKRNTTAAESRDGVQPDERLAAKAMMAPMTVTPICARNTRRGKRLGL